MQKESDYVILTDSDKNYEDFTNADISFIDSGLGIKYERSEIQEDTLLLLRYNCPDEGCDVACLGWPDLHRHVKTAHNKMMCDLCTRNKKVFTHEHELFTKDELRRHEEKGDDKPGAADQSGFRGHPKCGFCRRHFYSDDELYKHCREQHERCHICDRTNPGQPQYYLNYDTLEQHFRADHQLCLDRECLEKKFVVFESEMDLRAHQIESHPNGLTKDHRRVDLSDFAVRERYQPSRGGRGDRGGASRGRGRDPNVDPLPSSSAQPLRRDELAFQRTMAISGSQPGVSRTFNGALSSNPPPAPSAEAQARARAAARAAAFPSLADVSRTLPSETNASTTVQPSTTVTREQEARQLRHQAVSDRASNLLKGDQTKLASFRNHVSSYKNSSITAPQLIETFFSLFDASSTDMGKLVKELADIFEIPAKKEALLKAWNDWRAINEDYPSLPGSSSNSHTVIKAHGGNKILRLKSSTAQSSRVANSQNASWGASSGSTTSLFPTLPVNTSSKRNNASKTSTPWAGAMPPSSSHAPIQSQQSTRSTKQPTGAVGDISSFPSLPAAAKPSLPSFSPGFNGPLARRIPASGGSGSVWGSGGSNGESAVGEGVNGNTESDSAAGKKKSGGRKKQLVLHFG